MKKMILLFFLILTSTLFSQQTLRFGMYPLYNSRAMLKIFAPIAEKVEQETGYTIELMSSPGKDEFNEKTHSGYYDIVWTCNACYFTASDEGIIRAIARGEPSFRGVVMVRKDSGIDSITQITGKNIGAIGRYSYAGYLFLKKDLQNLGISIEDQNQVDFNLKSEAIPFRIYNREYHVGIFSEDTLVGSDLLDNIRDQLKIIHYSTDIPRFPFSVRTDLPEETALKIQKALTSITIETEGMTESLGKLHLTRISECTDRDYDSFKNHYYEVINNNH